VGKIAFFSKLQNVRYKQKMEGIRTYFNKFIKITDEEWNAFASIIQKQEYSKRELILSSGTTCDFIAFVGEGMFRFYYVDEGDEKVTAFFFPGDFVSNYRSFLTDQPSDHNIESMKESVIYKVKKKDLFELYDQYPAIDRLGRLVAENLYLTVAKRLDEFLYSKPEERYRNLQNRNSKLLQEVPQYMLASYLGVKPETLSRIRMRK
jgi:CRP-like cAMP-binding protein